MEGPLRGTGESPETPLLTEHILPVTTSYPLSQTGTWDSKSQADTVPLAFYKKKSKTDPEPQAPQPSFYNGWEIVACPPFTGCPAQTHTVLAVGSISHSTVSHR